MSTLRKGMGALLLLALTLTCMMVSQQSHAQYKKKIIKNWINWNGVFREGVDSIKQKHEIDRIKGEIAALSAVPVDEVIPYKGKLTSYLRKVNKKKGYRSNQFIVRRIITKYCSNNDPLLWNIRVDVEVNEAIDTATGSQPGVIPPKPTTKPQGEPLAILDQNSTVIINPENLAGAIQPDSVLRFPRMTIADDAVIAVLDTGIDTALFVNGMRSEILWNGPLGSKNLLLDADPNNYFDDYPSRHGTSVASIALNSFYQASDSSTIPKLMVLKVMNSAGEGTIFELCCGLSYAADNNATVINASMGYYGFANDVLNYYAGKCKNDSIPVVASAGNAEGSRLPDLICSETINDNNRLNVPDHLFFPACLAHSSFQYSVISVTGFRSPGVPCYYQNYSSEFITMGVLNERSELQCCAYQLSFINSDFALEGSSFATPVVSGRLAFKISQIGHHSSMAEYMRLMEMTNAPQTTATPSVTQGNQYISY